MKNLRARTKFCKEFKRLPLKITDETAAVMMNGKLVDMGRKCFINGREVRVAFCSDAQLKFFESRQEFFGKPMEYYGRVKDDVYFVHGWHEFSYKGSAMMVRAKHRQVNGRAIDELTRDKCFTGKHRSSDQRAITAAIKIPAKIKEGKSND